MQHIFETKQQWPVSLLYNTVQLLKGNVFMTVICAEHYRVVIHVLFGARLFGVRMDMELYMVHWLPAFL